MAYFSSFPSVFYNNSATDDATKTLVTNILVSPKFTDFFKSEGQELYLQYIVKDLEKPEYLAAKFYADVNLYWVILLFNSITDPYFGWPLNDADMQHHIEKNYAGQAIYIEPTFYKNNEIQTYPHSKAILDIGATITQGSKTGTILSWDPTLLKLVVDTTDTFDTTRMISTTNKYGTVKIDPALVEADNTYALHHFEDDDGNWLNPYNNLDNDTSFESSYLYYYIHNAHSGLTVNAISNRQHEIAINDRKRLIKILKPQYVQYVLQELNALFKKK
jgi:hypothetical protein